MKLHGDGVVAIAANVVAGRDLAIFQPQALKKAGGAAEARVDIEEDVIAADDLVWNEWNARQRSEFNVRSGGHEGSCETVREIQARTGVLATSSKNRRIQNKA